MTDPTASSRVNDHVLTQEIAAMQRRLDRAMELLADAGPRDSMYDDEFVKWYSLRDALVAEVNSYKRPEPRP